MRYYAYALLVVVTLVVAGLAAMLASFPGPALHSLIALTAVSTAALVVIWVGLATYSLIKSRLRRISR